MTYGYRYAPTSTVFDLAGLGLGDAIAEVERRRDLQGLRGGPVTVELVESTPDGWRRVPLSPAPNRAPQARHTLPPEPDGVERVLADIAGLPRRSGRARRRR